MLVKLSLFNKYFALNINPMFFEILFSSYSVCVVFPCQVFSKIPPKSFMVNFLFRSTHLFLVLEEQGTGYPSEYICRTGKYLFVLSDNLFTLTHSLFFAVLNLP